MITDEEIAAIRAEFAAGDPCERGLSLTDLASDALTIVPKLLDERDALRAENERLNGVLAGRPSYDALEERIAKAERERDEAVAKRNSHIGRLANLAISLRDMSPGPHPGPMDAEQYVPLVRQRIAELEADGAALVTGITLIEEAIAAYKCSRDPEYQIDHIAGIVSGLLDPDHPGTALMARVDALEKALRDLLLWFVGNPDESANDQFERVGKDFYAATGKLRPGQSWPIEMARPPDDELRETFLKWAQEKQAALVAVARAALDAKGD